MATLQTQKPDTNTPTYYKIGHKPYTNTKAHTTHAETKHNKTQAKLTSLNHTPRKMQTK